MNVIFKSDDVIMYIQNEVTAKWMQFKLGLIIMKLPRHVMLPFPEYYVPHRSNQ